MEGNVNSGKLEQDIFELIDKSNNVWIFPHINLDGDAVGSAYGLKAILEEQGKTVEVITEKMWAIRTNAPENGFIEADPVKIMSAVITGEETFVENTDLIIAVDSADDTRLGIRLKTFKSFTEQGKTIVFDHHLKNKLDATFKYLQPELSSCAEVLCELFLKNRAKEEQLSPMIANNLLLAIFADTGRFMHNYTDSTFSWATLLAKYCPDVEKIIKALYKSKSIAARRLVGKVFEEMREVFPGVWIAYLSLKDVEEAGGTDYDMDSFSNEMLETDGVDISAFIREVRTALEDGSEGRCFKVSMRSNSDFNVRDICAPLGGGGHAGASGCTLEASSIEEAYKMLLPVIEREMAKQKK